MPNSIVYEAFISYSHLDNKQESRAWASWLQNKIESYNLPKDLVGKENKYGFTIPDRIYPVFRDEEALPATHDLNTEIRSVLQNSRTLIALISRNSLNSNYVTQEIQYFKKLGKSDRIIYVIIDEWLDKQSRQTTNLENNKSTQEAFQSIAEELELQIDGTHIEPLYADLRLEIDGVLEQGWTTPKNLQKYLLSKKNLSKRQSILLSETYQAKQNREILKVLAAILGVSLDELTERDKKRVTELNRKRKYKQRKWGIAIGILITLSIFSWYISLLLNDKALIEQSKYLLEQAKVQNDKGNYELALLLGLNAVPGKYGGRRPMPGDISELNRSLSTGFRQTSIRFEQNIRHMEFSPDSSEFFVQTVGKNLRVFDSQTIEELIKLGNDMPILHATYSSDGLLIALAHKDSISIWSRITNSQIKEIKATSTLTKITFGFDDSKIFAGTNLGEIYAWEVKTGKRVLKTHIDSDEDYLYESIDYIDVNKYRNLILTKDQFSSSFYVFSTIDGKQISKINAQYPISPKSRYPHFTGSTEHIVYYSTEGTHVLNLNDHSNQLIPQRHVIYNSNGKKSVMLPSNNKPVGDADEIYRVQSYRNVPLFSDYAKDSHVHLRNNIFAPNILDAFFSPQDRYIVTSDGHDISLWRPNSGGILDQEIDLMGSAFSITFSPNSKYFVTKSSNDNKAWVYQLEYWPNKIFFGGRHNLYNINISNTGKFLFLPPGTESKHSRVFNLSKKNNQIVLKDICELPLVKKFSSDDKILYVRCNQDSTGHIYDLNTSKEKFSLDSENDSFSLVNAFSHKSKYLVSFLGAFQDKQLRIIDLSGETKKTALVNIGVDGTKQVDVDFFFNIDGNIVAIQHDVSEFTLVDLNSSEVLSTFKLNQGNRLVTFESRNELFVYTNDKYLSKIHVEDGEPKNSWQPRKIEGLTHMFLLSKEPKLITASDLGFVQIWSSETGELLKEIQTKPGFHKYRVSASENYLFMEGVGSLAIISLRGMEIYFKSTDMDIVQIDLEEDSNTIKLISDKSIRQIGLSKIAPIKDAIKYLRKGRRCLTDRERYMYQLPKLSWGEKLERDCI